MKISDINPVNQLISVLTYYNIEPEDKIACPIHQENTPSCLIDFNKGTYYCFGCYSHGDAITLIKEVEGLNDLKAMHKLHKIINKKCTSKLDYDKIILNNRKEKVNKKEAIQESKQYFIDLPKEKWIKNTRAKRYIMGRGYDIKTILEAKIKLNIHSKNYPIICPIIENNKFTGYVCRTILEDTSKKYLYNPGFRRAETFLGNIKDDWLFVTEGYFDWLSLRKFGIKNAIAILGWKITKYQIESILKVTNKVVSALDNTPTGEKGTKELQKYFKVRRLYFPENCKDVGDISDYEFNKCYIKTFKGGILNGRKS